MDNTNPSPVGRAVARWVPTSAGKARRSVDLIRGKPVDEARRVLAFSPHHASSIVAKVLESAVANAVSNHGLPQDALRVVVAVADEGPTRKRWVTAGRGRAAQIRRRSTHITIVVGG